MKRLFASLLCFSLALCLWAIDKEWMESHYQKKEVMIPMRDGTRLYTAIYTPISADASSPILIRRTPYGCAYGNSWESAPWKGWHKYAEEGYIFVFQDVRGKGKSEGLFVDIRPLLPLKHAKKAFDEATDTYDTADWLLKHVPNNNGNIGISGNSYCGFYAIQGAISGHPAIKAAVPQAPVYSWFRGDDFHHNGAFMLRDAFGFTNRHCRLRKKVGQEVPSVNYFSTDEYSFYKDKTVKELSELFKGEVPFWDDMCAHPDEDGWWMARDYSQALGKVEAAVMVVGGLWDAEDYYGACQLYKNLLTNSPSKDIRVTIGPWPHGGWNGTANALGNYAFGEQNQSLYYQDEIEFPFLQHYLKDASVPLSDKNKARIFVTGVNQWREYAVWENGKNTSVELYLHQDGSLSTTPPLENNSSTTYTSDPRHPVPFMEGTLYKRPAEYMTADQRFAERRSDVLTFKTEPLQEDLMLSGDLTMMLQTSISTTDADFVVKLIDIYPDDYSKLNKGESSSWNGYELPVRMDIMRGRYRNGFAQGQAFVPNELTQVQVPLQPISHTFRKGHRIGVQIQSSWFPLADMNPQQFVNIYECSRKDFKKSDITIYHQQKAASKLVIGGCIK